MSIVAPYTGLIASGQWEQLAAAWPDGERLLAAFRLALHVDTAADLLAGRCVSRGRLDPVGLVKAREESLVRLVAPAELLPKEAA